jgi:hypothetical protein
MQIRMREERMNRKPALQARTPREELLWKRIAGHNLARYQRELEWVNWVKQELKDIA